MKTIFQTKKLWEVVEGGVPNPPAQGDHSPEAVQQKNQCDKAFLKDLTALQILQTAVSDFIFPRIAPASSAKEAWNALELEFQGSPQVRMIKLQSLRRDYENLKMNDDDNIKVFTGKLIDLGNQLRVHGEEKTDYQIVQKILISLPARFDSIVAVLEQTKDLETLAVTDLIGTLQAQENRFSLRDENSTEGAFNAQSRGKKSDFKGENRFGEHQVKEKWCDVCRIDNHKEKDCWKKQNSNVQKEGSKKKKKCYYCDKAGHFSRDCPLKKHDRAHMSLEEEDEEEEVHMLFSASEQTPTITKEEVWLVDSGCTNHMTKEEKYFITLDRSIKIPIKVGNGEVVMTSGKGDIAIMTNKGKRVIKDVFLVSGLEKNLLSVPQVISHGYRVMFEDKRCIILDPMGKKIMEIKMVHKSFPIKWNSSQESAMIAREEEMELWHRRLVTWVIQKFNLLICLPKHLATQGLKN